MCNFGWAQRAVLLLPSSNVKRLGIFSCMVLYMTFIIINLLKEYIFFFLCPINAKIFPQTLLFWRCESLLLYQSSRFLWHWKCKETHSKQLLTEIICKIIMQYVLYLILSCIKLYSEAEQSIISSKWLCVFHFILGGF